MVSPRHGDTVPLPPRGCAHVGARGAFAHYASFDARRGAPRPGRALRGALEDGDYRHGANHRVQDLRYGGTQASRSRADVVGRAAKGAAAASTCCVRRRRALSVVSAHDSLRGSPSSGDRGPGGAIRTSTSSGSNRRGERPPGGGPAQTPRAHRSSAPDSRPTAPRAAAGRRDSSQATGRNKRPRSTSPRRRLSPAGRGPPLAAPPPRLRASDAGELASAAFASAAAGGGGGGAARRGALHGQRCPSVEKTQPSPSNSLPPSREEQIETSGFPQKRWRR